MQGSLDIRVEFLCAFFPTLRRISNAAGEEDKSLRVRRRQYKIFRMPTNDAQTVDEETKEEIGRGK